MQPNKRLSTMLSADPVSATLEARPTRRGRTLPILTGTAAGLALFGLMTTASLAQNPHHIRLHPDPNHNPTHPSVTKTLSQAHIDPAWIKTNKRPAIPYRPLELVDPKTGRPIPPDTVGTLSNGKKITAGEYLRQRNLIEKGLNAWGYSLRNSPPNVVLQEPVIGKAEMERQKAAFAAMPRTQTHPKTPRDVVRKPIQVGGKTIQATTFDGRVIDPAQMQELSLLHRGANGTASGVMRPSPISPEAHRRIVELRKANPSLLLNHNLDPNLFHIDPSLWKDITWLYYHSTPIDKHQGWNWQHGGDFFGAYLNGSIDAHGVAVQPEDGNHLEDNFSEFHGSLQGKAGVQLLKNDIDVIQLDGHFDSVASPPKTHMAAHAYVFGIEWSTEKDGPQIEDSGNIWSQGFDVHTPDIDIPVGWFTVTGQVGIGGSAGINYSYYVNAMNIGGNLTPFVHSNVYAHAGLGLGVDGIDVAEAGIEATMTLINDDMTVGVNLGIGWLFGFYLQDEVYCLNNLSALDGHVDAYVQLFDIDLGFVDIKGPRYSFDLWNWSGFHDQSTWFDDSPQVQPLNWQ